MRLNMNTFKHFHNQNKTAFLNLQHLQPLRTTPVRHQPQVIQQPTRQPQSPTR